MLEKAAEFLLQLCSDPSNVGDSALKRLLESVQKMLTSAKPASGAKENNVGKLQREAKEFALQEQGAAFGPALSCGEMPPRAQKNGKFFRQISPLLSNPETMEVLEQVATIDDDSSERYADTDNLGEEYHVLACCSCTKIPLAPVVAGACGCLYCGRCFERWHQEQHKDK